jgi:hypothetical protein
VNALESLVGITASQTTSQMSWHVLESQAVMMKLLYRVLAEGGTDKDAGLDEKTAKHLLSILCSSIRQFSYQVPIGGNTNASGVTTASERALPGSFVTKGGAIRRSALTAGGTGAARPGGNGNGSVMRWLWCDEDEADGLLDRSLKDREQGNEWEKAMRWRKAPIRRLKPFVDVSCSIRRYTRVARYLLSKFLPFARPPATTVSGGGHR